ncbi:cystatin-M-like [Fukomys damarensis]|uniref:cystatin-M-like n=1 Tax=Fukomys damarensis TaxID=885580 RepID=UPI00053F8117|nr:cystatin-M-like [Fukomys damarensis]
MIPTLCLPWLHVGEELGPHAKKASDLPTELHPKAAVALEWWSQLVAGVKYYLTMDLESTACRKTRVSGDHMDLTTCPLATGVEQEKLRCDFEILEVPWKNSTELLKHKCMQQ